MSSFLNDAINVIDEQNLDKERQYGRTIGIHAPARRGKTLTMLMLIILYLEKRPYLKGVITNLNLKLAGVGLQDKYVPLENIKQLEQDEYKSFIIAIDEFRSIIDSRMSSSFKNIFITNMLADTGKFKQILLLTDQDANAIDRRVRVNVDAVLRPQVDFDTGYCTVKVVKNYRAYFILQAYEDWNKYDVEFYFPFREYYEYYDTEQKIHDYVLTFTPEDFLEVFLKWFKERDYHKMPNMQITTNTVLLWKEMNGVTITRGQISALMEYMRRETELNVRGRKI